MKNPILRACAMLVAGVGLWAMCAAAQDASGSDPIDLFARMYPVFAHDRCTGCHNRVNPELATGNNHAVGQVTDNRECTDCHTAVPGWKTRRDLAFHGKSVKQLCQMQSRQVHSMLASGAGTGIPNITQLVNAEYLSHLASDSLIGAAFAGNRGGATSQVNKPPMSRDEFVKAAREWLDAGAGCGGWEGTITQKEEFHSNYSYPMPIAEGSIDIQVNETAQREIKITRIAGSSTGTFTMGGHETIVQTMHLIAPNGPCTAVNTADDVWIAPSPPVVDVPVRVQTKPDGSYTIHFYGPEEKTTTNSTGHMVNDCGVVFPHFPQDPPTELTWPIWHYTIRCPSNDTICQMFDPDNKTLAGTTEETVLGASDAAERRSWLNVSPVGTSRSDDGTPIPVKVTTTWDLSLKE